MSRLVVIVCFFWPLFNTCLNFQNVVSMYIGEDEAQLIAYANLLLVIAGTILILRQIEVTSKTCQLWFVFYMLYFSFGILATGITGFETSEIAIAIIPVVYFTGFYFLLSNKSYRKGFIIVLTVSLLLSSFFTILMFKLNFNFTSFAVHGWDLDRAEGLYGDANNSALASIMAFLFFDRFYQPTRTISKAFKFFVLLATFYSLFLTYSTTGLFAFAIILVINNFQFFRGIRLVLLGIFVAIFYGSIFFFRSKIGALNLSSLQTGKLENIVNLLTFNFENIDDSGRGALIQNVLKYLYENPILGNGINFSGHMRGHNTFLNVLVDAGIICFMFFLFMLIYYFIKSFAIRSELRFFTISVLVVLYIFMMSLQTVINQPYLIVMFVLVGYIIDKQDLGRDESHELRKEN